MDKKLRDMSKEERLRLFKGQIRTTEDAFLGNSILISAVDHKISDVQDEAKRDYHVAAYEEAKDRAGAAFATLVKAIFKQNRAFFACTQEALIKAMRLDPDNTMDVHKLLKVNRGSGRDGDSKPIATMSRVGSYWIDMGVEMLWASKARGMAAAFVITNPHILELLDLSPEVLKKQYQELQQFCQYFEVPEEWVFDSVGDIRLQKEKIRHHTTSASKEISNLKKSDYLSTVEIDILNSTASSMSSELVAELNNNKVATSEEDWTSILNFQSINPEIT